MRSAAAPPDCPAVFAVTPLQEKYATNVFGCCMISLLIFLFKMIIPRRAAFVKYLFFIAFHAQKA